MKNTLFYYLPVIVLTVILCQGPALWASDFDHRNFDTKQDGFINPENSRNIGMPDTDPSHKIKPIAQISYPDDRIREEPERIINPNLRKTVRDMDPDFKPETNSEKNPKPNVQTIPQWQLYYQQLKEQIEELIEMGLHICS